MPLLPLYLLTSTDSSEIRQISVQEEDLYDASVTMYRYNTYKVQQNQSTEECQPIEIFCRVFLYDDLTEWTSNLFVLIFLVFLTIYSILSIRVQEISNQIPSISTSQRNSYSAIDVASTSASSTTLYLPLAPVYLPYKG
ncbi:hypothetical protein L3Y34_013109 [Caenorhabditis briggsae]|uniref:Uncharacterized protein n=1 Tax=Caenorhabditis briggsae TaxID=6238 RepID=A0AAE9CVZ4_CAEBR|nr:hypothetical protein L3Y34_013109 [Caenorhabditis briggsae]